ncbi:MAG: type II toxin-antitoxin system HigB family toxin [Cytophagales bacterium]|nr:MAG: type II toxin-antitoxin system HigB family toxin [Cytophagales bacterium]
MRIHALKTLKQFWQTYPDAEASLRNWYTKIESKTYSSPQEVVGDFNNADYVGNERVVFNIARNKYRLIAAFNYVFGLCFVKFIGTHKEYDAIDAKTVEYKP